MLHMQQEKLLLDWEDIQAQRNPDPQRTRDLIAAIEARLAQRPDKLQYQFLLARYSTSLGDYERAIAAYEQAVAVDRSSRRALAELAHALMLGSDNQMAPRLAS